MVVVEGEHEGCVDSIDVVAEKAGQLIRGGQFGRMQHLCGVAAALGKHAGECSHYVAQELAEIAVSRIQRQPDRVAIDRAEPMAGKRALAIAGWCRYQSRRGT